MNRFALAVLLLSTATWGQVAPGGAPPTAPGQATACDDCGTVRSVRRIEKPVAAPTEDAGKPSGLVATIPFGGKGTVGSSVDAERAERPPVVTYEIVVLMENGKYRLVQQPEAGDLKAGDKVRVDKGRAVRR